MRTARVRSSTAQTIALGSAAVLLVTLGSIACSDQATAPPTAVHSTAEIATVRTVTPDQQARVDRAMAQMRWVGEAHDEAMAVVRRHIASARPGRGRPAKLSARAKCRAIEEATDVALTAVDRANGRNRGRAERAVQLRAVPEIQRCARELSVSTATPLAAATSASTSTSTDEITGAYEPYAALMYNAVVASGGSVAGVSAAVNSVMVQAAAAGIPDPDLQAVAAIGSLANASAQEWNAFDWSAVGGDDRGDCTLSATCDQMQMSMFSSAAEGWANNIARVVVADVGGCFATVKSWGALRLLLRMAVPHALAAECGYRGAATSAGAIVALLM